MTSISRDKPRSLKLAYLSVLVLIGAVIALVLRPAQQPDELRAAEQLWQAGRVTEALRSYQTLRSSESAPALVDIRLAAITLLRGDCAQAQMYAATALGKPLRRDEAAQAHLIVGQCAAQRGALDRAQAEWLSVDPQSPYQALVDVLSGEIALRGGLRSSAIDAYTSALAGPLPEPWRSFARLRLALALAPDAPETALRHLQSIPETLPDPAPETRPLLPLTSGAIVGQARQLAAILAAPPEQQRQLIGQQLLDLNLLRLAIATFEQVPVDAPRDPLAEAHAAYARWQLGQTSAATTQLRELVAQYPQQPLIATLYATIAINAGNLDEASAVLDAAEARAPLDPAIVLVRSDLLVARRQYPEAIVERRRARDIARPEVRGRYALALAEQHLSLTYRVCDSGITAASEATTIAADDPQAWQLLASMFYHCRSYTQAAEAAQRGLALAPNNPGLRFFLGAALWEDGNQDAARPHLIAAADLAPASEWRKRAEQTLGW
ncbi:MAG TPA: tetratricopeptide repeat protein [Herpetosiphonaceae bacterium]